MSAIQEGQRIDWYRSPIDRKTLSLLNQRSDWQGFAQTIGHLGLLMGTGASAWLASKYLPLWALLVILFIHGTFFAFLLNAFHEFCHKTVFKTKALNIVFLYIVSFLSWNNPVFFWASHQEHHKYTLHPPRDLEVVLPIKMTLTMFLKSAVINPWDFIARLKSFFRLSFGKLEGEWENALFPETEQELRRSLFNWARFHLIGHALIVIVSLYFGAWIVLVVLTLAPFYGGALQFLCNNTQHIGLQDNVSDFRLCTRTIYLNPFIGFLYWYMHYHTEHHMYAAVPCYNLAKLHEQIKADLPPISSGLVETWKEIIAILAKQKLDPSYQYVAQLPQPSNSSKV
jgi:fatty acid desaturase